MHCSLSRLYAFPLPEMLFRFPPWPHSHALLNAGPGSGSLQSGSDVLLPIHPFLTRAGGLRAPFLLCLPFATQKIIAFALLPCSTLNFPGQKVTCLLFLHSRPQPSGRHARTCSTTDCLLLRLFDLNTVLASTVCMWLLRVPFIKWK